jgi:antitoxin ParD1/3/4
MNILLQPDVQKFVEEKVKSGQYASPEEAVNLLLTHVRQQEELSPQDIEEVRSEIDRGIREAERGEFAEFTAEDIIAEGRAARTKVT